MYWRCRIGFFSSALWLVFDVAAASAGVGSADDDDDVVPEPSSCVVGMGPTSLSRIQGGNRRRRKRVRYC